MKLPLPGLFTKKEAANNYYLSLLLRDEKAVAIVLEEIEGKLQVIGQSETSFSTRLEDVPLEELLESLDKTISKAEESLPPNLETEKTVFGVKENWVEDKKIKKEYLSTLKKLCDALSLQPIGFMVSSEAISHLLTEDEGAPLSAILAEIGTQQATLTLFRAGRIIEVHSAKVTDSIPQTVDRLLHHFTTDVLPSRIIVFEDGNAEALAQDFIAHHWSKSIPFLHLPQISVLPQEFDRKAMVYGTAEQMGFSVLDTFGDTKAITIDTAEKATSAKKAKDEAASHKEEENDEATKEDDDKKFKDEEEHDQPEHEEATKEDAQDIPLKGDNFGFVSGQDIASVTPAAKGTPHQTHLSPTHSSFERSSDNVSSARLTREEEDNESPGIMERLTSLVPSLSLPKFPLSLPPLAFGGKMIFLPIALVVIIGLVALYFFTVKATVTLHMETKGVDEATEISLRTDSENDLAQKILAAQTVETSLEGTVSTNATGKKEIGEKAKGTMTLYNSGEAKRTIPAGTVVTSGNDLDFVTDKEVVVASASGDIFSGTKPGTVSVAVTAKNIGTEYNLPSNTKFTVAGVSTLAGKNDSAFSGGTKKEVTVVAQKDITDLNTKLPKDLEAKAKEAIQQEASSGQTTLPVFTDVTISKKSFDYDLGEETKKVTLKGTVTFTTLSYTTEDLKQLAESTIKGNFSQNQAISEKGISAELEDIEIGEDNEATAKLVMRAGLLPKLDKDAIAKDLTGKSFSDAEAYLKDIPQVQTADIVLSPDIPLLPKLLPRINKNITIEFNTNE